MQIFITRSREAQKAINQLRKNLKQKTPLKKLAILVLAGLALFIYGKGMTFEDFSGYCMLAMLCWGAAVVIYLDAFYPKVTTDARLMMKGYNDIDAIINFKIEITDEYLVNEAGYYYTRLNWAHSMLLSCITSAFYYMQAIVTKPCLLSGRMS